MIPLRKLAALAAALFLLNPLPAGAGSHSPTPRNSALLADTEKSYGGLFIDFDKASFGYRAPGGGSLIRYPSFAAMFATLGGTAVTSAGASCYNAAGVLVSFPANTPRQPCYRPKRNDDGSKSYETLGLTIEQAATQILPHPSLYTGSDWTKLGATVASQTQAAPDGSTKASLIKEDGSTGEHGLLWSSARPPAVLGYVAGCYVGAGSGGRRFAITVDDGAGSGATLVVDPADSAAQPRVATFGSNPFTGPTGFNQLGGSVGGFHRVSLAFTSNGATTLRAHFGMANGSGAKAYAGDGRSALVLWGCNITHNTVGSSETELAPSSVIASAKTRVRDQITLPLPTAMQGLPAYSEYVDIMLPAVLNALSPTFTSLNSADDSSKLALTQMPVARGGVGAVVVDDGTNSQLLSLLGPYNASDRRAAFFAAFSAGNYYLVSSLLSKRTNPKVTIYPTSPITQLRIGAQMSSSTKTANFSLSHLVVFPKALPNGLLDDITIPAMHEDPDAIVPPNGFDATTVRKTVPAGLEVWRLAPPLKSNAQQDGYAQYPVSVAITQDMKQINDSAATRTTAAWFYWAARCNLCSNTSNKGPNSYGALLQVTPASKGFVDFDDRTKADANTLARLLYALGYPAHAARACPAGQSWCGYLDVTRAAGIPDTSVVAYADVAANPGAYFTTGPNAGNQMTALNLVVLPPLVLNANAQWVNCDCEMADNRLASKTLVFVKEMAAEAHNAPIPRKLAISADSFQGSGKPSGFCGIGAVWPSCDRSNLTEIAAAIDLLYVPTSEPPGKGFTFASQLQNSLAMIGRAPVDHLMIQFSLGVWPGGTTIGDAKLVHDTIARLGMTHVNFTPLYNVPGGGKCRWTNIKIATVLGLPTGTCDVPTP